MSSNYFCEFCGNRIPAEKRHYSPANMPKRFFCNKEHRALWDKEHGIFKAMSVRGRSARSQAVKTSNRLNPRRKKAMHGEK